MSDTPTRYLVAEDGYQVDTLWVDRGDGLGPNPLVTRYELDRRDPALWTALLRGLGLEVPRV